ncbi:hypothetical protein Tco_1295228 [Tanacetum coccineum]
MIHPGDLKSDKESDDNKIDIIQSSRGIVDTQGQKKFLEASHDKINTIFNVESFIVELKVNIVTWNYLVNGMLLNLIKNLYVPFGIPFDPKRYYKDGVCTRILRRPISPYGVSTSEYAVSVQNNNFFNLCTDLVDFTDMALQSRDQRHQCSGTECIHYPSLEDAI